MKRIIPILLLSFLAMNVVSREMIVERMNKNTMEKRQKQGEILSDDKMYVILVGTGGLLNNTERRRHPHQSESPPKAAGLHT